MNDTQLVMYDEDYRKILAVIQKLVRDEPRIADRGLHRGDRRPRQDRR